MPTLAARRAMLGAFAAILTAVALVPATPAPVAAAGGTGFVEMANGYRSDASLGGVAYHSVLNQIAVERGRQLKRAGELGHDFDYLRRRFDEEGICWRGFGEIVAYNGSGDFSAFGRQWFNSTTHRNIMLGDYTHASGSREEDDGRWYGVMIFVKICGAEAQPITYAGFTDIADSSFRSSIIWVHERGIMDGCRDTAFCPRGDLTRGALAQALAEGLGLPSADRDFFADDGGSRFEDGINRLAAAGLARGCGDGNYCPSGNVRRGALATALATALRLPKARTDYFRDDEGSPHEANINRIAAAGITTGCDDRSFCPTRSVSRGHATVFLRRAFD